MLFIAVLAAVMAGLVVYRILNEKIPSPFASGRKTEAKRRSLKDLWKNRYGDKTKNAKADKERLNQLASFVGKLIPASDAAISEATQRIIYSGVKLSPAVFWALQMLFAFIGVLIGAYISISAGDTSVFQALLLTVFFGLLGSQIMNLYILMRRRKWRMALEEQLPNALDLMLVVVCAGSTLESAVKIVSESQEGELADALKDVVAETRYGSLTESLSEFAKRSGSEGLQIFTGTLQQGLATGASLVDILQMQAMSLRRKRRLLLETKVNELPTKLLFPMLAFCFPVMMIIILIPMVISMAQGFMSIFSG